MGVLPLERPRSQRKLGGFSTKKITTPNQIEFWGIADERKRRKKLLASWLGNVVCCHTKYELVARKVATKMVEIGR